MTYDYCVIGGGIVGLATAMRLAGSVARPSVVLVEKEVGLGTHQTGHNSGVIHSGIYYLPGSLKAEMCRKGAEATKAFCEANNVRYETCGKLLVATTQQELQRMESLMQRAGANAIEVRRLDGDELRELEPNVSGLGAILVPSTGIVDYAEVCQALGRSVASNGGEILMGRAVIAIQEDPDAVHVATDHGSIRCRKLVVCAGLQSDRLARMAGLSIDHRIIPFRGEYFRLAAERDGIVRHLIYPIPDPELPFLGVHLTRMIDGGVTVGPNAVLGFSREGYPRFSFDAGDVLDFVAFPGFWKTIAANWTSALSEMRDSLSKRGYLERVRKYCPSLELKDLLPHAAGVRAQAVKRDGTLLHDFLFLDTARMLHVCNAPSPAATSAIPIADAIIQRTVTDRMFRD